MPSYPKQGSISRGYATDFSNSHPQDVQSQAVRAEMTARAKYNFGTDGALPDTKPDPANKTRGNSEGMGLSSRLEVPLKRQLSSRPFTIKEME